MRLYEYFSCSDHNIFQRKAQDIGSVQTNDVGRIGGDDTSYRLASISHDSPLAARQFLGAGGRLRRQVFPGSGQAAVSHVAQVRIDIRFAIETRSASN